MRRDHRNLDLLPNQTEAGSLIPIHAAQSRTKVTVPQMGIGLCPLLRGVNRREELEAREVGAVIEEEGRGQVEVAAALQVAG